MNKPLVSIISPNFNGSSFITTTYQSIKNQTETRWEWVIIDDKSTDDSRELIEKLAEKDSRISPIFLEFNQGAAVARNSGLDASNSEYIAFLDIDDKWEKEKLEISLKYMISTKSDFTYTNYRKIKNSSIGNEIIKTPSEIYYEDLLKTCHICTSTVLIRREAVGTIRMENELRRGQDYVFWLELLRKVQNATRASEKPLTRYSVGPNSLSSNKFRKAYFQWIIYRRYLKLSLYKSFYYFIHYAIHGLSKFNKF